MTVQTAEMQNFLTRARGCDGLNPYDIYDYTLDAWIREFPNTKEAQVFQTVRSVEMPLLLSMREEYGVDRGWNLCKANILLAHFIRAVHDIPIRVGNDSEEHMELKFWIHDPKDNTKRWAFNDHTNILYTAGTEFGKNRIIQLDTVGDLLTDFHYFGGEDDTTRFTTHERETVMEESNTYFNLVPFDIETAKKLKIFFFHSGQTPTQKAHDSFVAVINSDQVFNNSVVTPFGERFDVS